MAWTVRSVRPTTGLMSRIRASGLRAISTSTCPCPVRSVHAPPLSSASVMPSSIDLASDFPREKTREIFVAFLLTGLQLQADHGTALGGRAGGPARRPVRARWHRSRTATLTLRAAAAGQGRWTQMHDGDFPVELVDG